LKFNTETDVEKKVDDILNQIGLERNFVLMECLNVNNAIAINLPSKLGNIRYIIYDSKFFKKLGTGENTDWGAMSILAHEIAHHLNGHTLSRAGSKPQLELEADEFSGFVLYKLGASLEQSLFAMKKVSNEKATKTHPAKKNRIAAITKGWTRAKSLEKKNENEQKKVIREEIVKKKVSNNIIDWKGNWIDPKQKGELLIDTTDNEIVVRKLTSSKGNNLNIQYVAKNDKNYLIKYIDNNKRKKTGGTLIVNQKNKDTLLYELSAAKENLNGYMIRNINRTISSLKKDTKKKIESDDEEKTSNLSLAITAGGVNIMGDLTGRNIFNNPMDGMKTLGFELSSRIRLHKQNWYLGMNYLHGSASGYNYLSALGYGIPANRQANNPWVANGYTGTVYYNYHTKIRALTLMGIYSTGKQHKFSADIGLGITGLLYASYTDALDGNGGTYQTGFITINGKQRDSHIFNDRKEIASELKDLFDGTYETAGESHNNRGWYSNYMFIPTVSVYIGFEYKLNSKFSITLKDQLIFTFDDLVDGQRWQERSAMTRDFDNIYYLGLGLRYNF
jgi:hypothetical protein